MRRMKIRVNRALEIFPIESWSTQLHRKKFHYACKISTRPMEWPFRVIEWHPNNTDAFAYRSRGRPRLRWDHLLSSFSSHAFGNSNWLREFSRNANIKIFEEEFEDFCEK